MKDVLVVSLADLHAEMGEEFKMPSDDDRGGRLGQLFLFLK